MRINEKETGHHALLILGFAASLAFLIWQRGDPSALWAVSGYWAMSAAGWSALEKTTGASSVRTALMTTDLPLTVAALVSLGLLDGATAVLVASVLAVALKTT